MNLDNTNMKEVGIIDLIDQLSVIDRKRQVTAACDSSPGIASLELRLI